MPQAPTRRNMLRLLAGLPLFAAAASPAAATPAAAKAQPIGRLIEQGRALPQVAQRIDFISHALLGVRYQAHTLIGGPNYPERFVVRDDAFDCVTFCEVVLAAAVAANASEFETALRRIRYQHGTVQWYQRNNYFADWSQRNIANGICEAVKIEPSLVIDKTVTWHRELGRHPVSILAVPKAALLEQSRLLSAGDIIGFTSRRSDLDYFHTGLIAFDRDGTLLLRHASQRRGRVVEEKMAAFVTVNPVKYVTLLRATERRFAVEDH
jgi:N-acetylmuramoyl-L-alanine amidase-like protein